MHFFLEGLLSRHRENSKFGLKIVLDILSIGCQITGFVAWPLLEYRKDSTFWQIWFLPLSCFCISCGWWENFVDNQASLGISYHQNTSFFSSIYIRLTIGFMKWLAKIKYRLWKSRYYVYIIISVWKILVFFLGMVLCLYLKLDDIDIVFRVDDAYS